MSTLANYGTITGSLSGLMTFSFFLNKYVLSVLGFQFPMVFQGWQTLVGFIVLKLTNNPRCCFYYNVPTLDRSGFVSLLPNFLFFTTSIIAGSKALANISLVIFIAVTNAIPSAIHLFVDADKIGKNIKSVPLLASFFTLITSVAIFIYESKDNSLVFGESPYFWLLVHLICNVALSLHGRIADARYGPIDKLYYSYGFSLIVLAPASFYLEEAFQALNFQHRKQVRFIVGSILSAVAGVALNLYLSHHHNKTTYVSKSLKYPPPHHVGSFFASILSIFAFEFKKSLPWWGWVILVLNHIVFLFVPSHLKADEITDMTTKTTSLKEWSKTKKNINSSKSEDDSSMTELLIES